MQKSTEPAILSRVMGAKPPYRRTQYLVDVKYQLRFVTRLFMAVLGIAAASGLAASSVLWKTMYLPEEASHATLIACLVSVAVTLLFELLLAVPILFYAGIRQSHRVVGPMKRLTQTLEAIGRGDFSQRITLRNGDALEELAGTINRMAERLQQRFPPPPQ